MPQTFCITTVGYNFNLETPNTFYKNGNVNKTNARRKRKQETKNIKKPYLPPQGEVHPGRTTRPTSCPNPLPPSSSTSCVARIDGALDAFVAVATIPWSPAWIRRRRAPPNPSRTLAPQIS